MRKTDYALLARIIAKQRADELAVLNDPRASERQQYGASIALLRLRDVAIAFAQGASVNASEFLRACGLEGTR